QLARLDRALAWLAAGEAIAPLAHGWPLSQLFARADAVSERIAQGAERERMAASYREEALRQVSEAAASEERNRLARELHDSIKQQLFSIGVSAAAARARGGADTAALDDIERGAREAQVEMTALLQQLRPAPLENVGLVAALRDQCEALGYRTGAEVSVTIGALPGEDRLPPRAQEQLFRIAQEALANIARHARARHVWLRLEAQGDTMLLEARDDGQGFTPETASGGMGLGNLRERARALGGSAEITSAPGQGTTVRISMPRLAPLHISAEERSRQARLDALARDAGRWLALCFTALDIAGVLLIFGLPFWSVALGLAAALASALVARLPWREIVALTGRDSEQALAQSHRMREFGAWLLFALGLCVWYLPASQPIWGSGARLLGVAAGSALLLALGALGWERWRRATLHYYRMLPPAQRRVAIQKRWDE
ncbi:MAG: sensor histidine kinase, partial [Chloroflexota bacterium]|nr:sensor histidine kinase [Chloroflexota bacterium]